VSRFPWRLVTLDLDGTLTRVHGWRFIAEGLGRLPEYEASERRFRAGAIGEDQHLTNMLRIPRGVPLDRLLTLVAATPKIGGIAPTVVALHGRGARVALLTHNPPYVCHWYVREYGLDGFGASDVPEPVDGILGEPGPVRADKPAYLARLLAQWGLRPGETAHVGDGLADAAIFSVVGGSVAINTRDDRIRGPALASLESESLLDLLPLLEEMRPRTPPDPPPGGL
jgi:phosphoserine phosphatase